MRLSFSHRTDPGRVRVNNQDAYSIDLLVGLPDAALLLVADGMGGYEGGEVASRLAIETVRSRVLSSAADWIASGSLEAEMVESIRLANLAILGAQRQSADLASMGTTMTAALIVGDRIVVGHIGDSKACLVRAAETTRVTADHNVPGELLQSGHLTAEQAAVHPQRHVLTRALGIDEDIIVDSLTETWRLGEVLLLCTDGLSNMVGIQEIQELVLAGFDEALANQLVDRANARGGHDNITVLAARWEG